MSYHWPGNIRELQNVIERAVILSRSTILEPDVLYLPQPAERVLEVPTASGAPPLAGTSTAAPPAAAEDVRTFAEAERQAIVEALSLTGWRISGRLGAAERLGLKPTTLHAKMKKLGIRRPAPVVPLVLRGAGQHR